MDDETMTPCDGCDRDITDEMYDANDGYCPACVAARMVCEGCDEQILKADAHKTHGTLCEGCGDAKDEETAAERLDALKDKARDALEAIIDSEDEPALKKALASLKRLQPKSPPTQGPGNHPGSEEPHH